MKRLTTGELAALFSITKHTVRHYIEIGLLVPCQKAENGYYLFDEEGLYQLYQILVFRNIGYTLQEIKNILKNDVLLKSLETAEKKLQNQLDELSAIKATVGEILQAQKFYKLDEIIFYPQPDRYFKKFPATVLDNGSYGTRKGGPKFGRKCHHGCPSRLYTICKF